MGPAWGQQTSMQLHKQSVQNITGPKLPLVQAVQQALDEDSAGIGDITTQST